MEERECERGGKQWKGGEHGESGRWSWVEPEGATLALLCPWLAHGGEEVQKRWQLTKCGQRGQEKAGEHWWCPRMIC
jgi:hypothetical protein